MDVRQMRLMRKFKLSADEAGELLKVGADTPGKVRALDAEILEAVLGKEKTAKIKGNRK